MYVRIACALNDKQRLTEADNKSCVSAGAIQLVKHSKYMVTNSSPLHTGSCPTEDVVGYPKYPCSVSFLLKEGFKLPNDSRVCFNLTPLVISTSHL